jgi:hypothetical protein
MRLNEHIVSGGLPNVSYLYLLDKCKLFSVFTFIIYKFFKGFYFFFIDPFRTTL